jgi:hypothetical protein
MHSVQKCDASATRHLRYGMRIASSVVEVGTTRGLDQCPIDFPLNATG